VAKKSRVYRRIKDDTPTFERLSAEEVERGLGAVSGPLKHQSGGSPFSITALRMRLATDVVSRGGRPSRKEAVAVKKIPVTAAEWELLGEITKAIREDGVKVTASQVAGVLLHQSLSQVSSRVAQQLSKDSSGGEHLSKSEVEEKVEKILQAAASAKQQLEQLRPVAEELLRRMKAGKGLESDTDL
jgi:hypothetical protein